MALSCSLSGVTRVKAAASGRRLAGRDDDLLSPPSPKLEELCAAIGFWAPADPHPEDGRKSPEMVEEFFQVLEGGETPGPEVLEGATTGLIIPATTEGSGGSKREPPLDSDEESDDEQPGPSWRVPKRYRRAEKSAAGVSAPPALPVPHRGPGASPSHQVEQEARASAGVQTEGADTPSTSAPALGPAQHQVVHPYVRLPIVPPGVIRRPWASTGNLGGSRRPVFSHELFLKLHNLLVQPSLDSSGVERLMTAAERLASYETGRLGAAPELDTVSHAVRELGRRFVLLNILHSAVRAVGLPEPAWWQVVVGVALDDAVFEPMKRGRNARAFNILLEQLLRAALWKYKSGGAPSDAEVVQLKRMLFCDERGPYIFRGQQWQPWRDDDAGASGQAP